MPTKPRRIMFDATGEVHKFLRQDPDDPRIGTVVCGDKFISFGQTRPHAEFEAAPKCGHCFRAK